MAKTRITLLGPPGCGKGTVGALLEKELSLSRLSVGDLIRDNIAQKTEFGLLAKDLVDSGKLVPDDLVFKEVKSALKDESFEKGVLYDGFPRTRLQAEILEKHKMEPGIAILLEASDDVLIKRLSSRRVCPKCHAVYNIDTNPSKKDGICDIDQEKIVQRDDDKPATIQKRLDVYRNQTRDVIDFYKDRGVLVKVDAIGAPDVILKRVLKVLPR